MVWLPEPSASKDIEETFCKDLKESSCKDIEETFCKDLGLVDLGLVDLGLVDIEKTVCIEAPTFFAGARKNYYPGLLRPDRTGTGGPGSRQPVTTCPGQKTLFFPDWTGTEIHGSRCGAQGPMGGTDGTWADGTPILPPSCTSSVLRPMRLIFPPSYTISGQSAQHSSSQLSPAWQPR